MGYVVFDTETVPDYTVWQPPAADTLPASPATEASDDSQSPNQEPPKPKRGRPRKNALPVDATPRIKRGVMPPLYACRPVVIAYAALDDDFRVHAFGCAGPQQYGMDEKRLLTEWSNFLTLNRPTIVTWFGRSFDMPVISLRSFRWGVAQPWHDREYRARYNEDRHIDLGDVMSEHGLIGRTGFKLDTIAKLMGLPGKDGIDGSMVEQLIGDGQSQSVEKYCRGDVLQTTLIFMRFMLMRGRISAATYSAAAERMVDTAKETTPELVARIDCTKLLLRETD